MKSTSLLLLNGVNSLGTLLRDFILCKKQSITPSTVCSLPTQRSASKWSIQTWPMCLIRRHRALITQRSCHMDVSVSSWMEDHWPRPAMAIQSIRLTQHVNSTASVRHAHRWTMAPIAMSRMSTGCIALIWTCRSLIVLTQVWFPFVFALFIVLVKNCARHLCECDRQFAFAVADAYKFYDDRYSHPNFDQRLVYKRKITINQPHLSQCNAPADSKRSKPTSPMDIIAPPGGSFLTITVLANF